MSKADVQPSMPVVQANELSPANQFLMTIQTAASDPAVDMDKMERLYTIYKDVRANEAKQAYNAAMVEVQKEIPAIEKRHFNKQTNSLYAKQEDILREIKPIWTKHGFSLSFYPGDNAPDGYVIVSCDVSHIGGDVRKFSYPCPIVNAGIKGTVNMTDTHARASAITYGERYLTGMIFSLETFVKDDDGNAAGAKVEKITEDQANTIHAKITENGLSMERFMGWLLKAWKCEAIADISVKAYPSVMSQLEAAIKNKKVAE